MHFGIYLVENGVITCDEFYEALKFQLSMRPQLGALALECRKLTMRQVFSVLRAQCDAPAKYFGELAVKAGYLTGEDLAQLVCDQTTHSTPFSEVLIELDILQRDAVNQYAREYRRSMEGHEEPELAAAGV
jgi:hypothetical protein